MNVAGLVFFCVCFASFWFSRSGRLRSVGAFIGASGCGGFEAGKGDSICREGVIGRRMLYEFYIKMLATNVELAHK